MSELPTELVEWASKSGPSTFLGALHARLVRGGQIRNWLRFKEPLDENERRQLAELFGDDGTVQASKVHLDRAQARLLGSRFPVLLEDLVAHAHGMIVTSTQRKAAATMRVQGARDDLMRIMRDVPQLDGELVMLAALEPSATNRVPSGTATRATTWTPYASAIKAAATWWPRYVDGKETSAKGLAATALGGSKNWTDAGRLAFQNLVGRPFGDAVQTSDTEIRLRGPIVWRLDGVIVDAAAGHPWVSVPAGGVLRHGQLDGDPDGILLIENQETFQQVCTVPDVHWRWLCVWSKGFASHGLVDFVRRFDEVPLAAWCDLDPSGIQIIADLMKRVGRDVTPVGMESELWDAAAKRHDTAPDRRKWQDEAAQLAEAGPLPLRALARVIATTGERVEQEELVVRDRVLPTLAARLRSLPWSSPSSRGRNLPRTID